MTLRPARGRAPLAALLLAAALAAPAAAQDRPAAAPAAGQADEPSRLELAAARARARAEAERPFFEARLPAPLREPGPRGLLWWQWLAFPAFAALALLAGVILAWLSLELLARIAARTRTRWDDLLLGRLSGPLRGLWAIAVFAALQPWLLLDDAPAGAVHRVLRAAAYLIFFWGGFRSVNVAFAAAADAPWTRANANLAGLLPIGRKISKAALALLGVVAVLNELGFQVASLLAGLGIGGIAVAFGAQKTIEHLFGSVAIGVDQPFRIGDMVKVEDFVGRVETIGLRSTRFRTLDRTLITIPNGRLADMRSETYAARDRIRLFVNLGLSYDTTADQMREVLSRIVAELRAHPRVHPEGISARFTQFLDSTLNVEVTAWFQTTDWDEFSDIRTEVHLQLMEIVERAGTSLAFPTRTVHLVSHEGAGTGAG